MADLKPCPFCGEKAKIVELRSGNSVVCTNTHCWVATKYYDTPEKAIAAWNRRAGNA